MVRPANQNNVVARSQPIKAKYRLEFSQSEKCTGSESANKSKEQVRSQPVRAKDWLEFSQLDKCSV